MPLTDTSTFSGLHGEIVDQVMGSHNDYIEYLWQECDGHVRVFYESAQFYKILAMREARNENQTG